MLLNLLIDGHHESSSDSPVDVDQRSLVEPTEPLPPDDLQQAVEAILVERVGASILHHHTTANSVPRVGGKSGGSSDRLNRSPSESVKLESDPKPYLCNGPRLEETELLLLSLAILVASLERIIETEIRSSISEYPLNKVRCVKIQDMEHPSNPYLGRDEESPVQSTDAVRLHDLEQEIEYALELTSGSAPNVHCQAGTCEIEGIDEELRRSTGQSARERGASKPLPEVLFLVDTKYVRQ